MEKFIAQQNIAHYLAKLKTEPHPVKRLILQGLLAGEEAKLASLTKEPDRPQKI